MRMKTYMSIICRFAFVFGFFKTNELGLQGTRRIGDELEVLQIWEIGLVVFWTFPVTKSF